MGVQPCFDVELSKMTDSHEDMPYINFDEKPVWNNETEKFPMTNRTITLPLKNGQQTRERFTVMATGSADGNRAGVQPHFPVTQLLQVNDTNLHAEIRHLLDIQGTDRRRKLRSLMTTRAVS